MDLRQCGWLAGLTIVYYLILHPGLAIADDVTPRVRSLLLAMPEGSTELALNIKDLVLDDAEHVPPICASSIDASPPQKVSIVSGISSAHAEFSTANSVMAKRVEELFPRCCNMLVERDTDLMIRTGAKLGLAARERFEVDPNIAAAMTLMIYSCDNEILETSYNLATGSDRVGQQINNQPTLNGPDTNPINYGGGGPGLPSAN